MTTDTVELGGDGIRANTELGQLLASTGRRCARRQDRAFPATLWRVDAVELGSASEHLLLSLEPDGPALAYLVADLSVDGMSATKKVYSHYASGWRELADFFAGLAADWRGWSGTREWTSLESDLKIEARHEFGHVQLHVTLRNPMAGWGNQGWSASADLTLEPGEQLSRVTDELKNLVDTSS